MSRPAIESYNSDFVEWTVRNAELLRRGRFDEVDLHHVIEEIEDLGKNWHLALDSHTYQLIAHLLKWEHQPEGRSGSWRGTMMRHCWAPGIPVSVTQGGVRLAAFRRVR